MTNKINSSEMIKWRKLLKTKEEKESKKKYISSETKRKNIKLWTFFYRNNISIYATHRLKINLFPFQHIVLYLMSKSIHFCYIANRGIGKSYLTAIYAMCKAMLYPNSEIGVVASTFVQGKVVVEKMENELCKRGDSPILKYLYDKKLIKFSYSQDEIKVDFLINNSKCIVMSPTPSARGKRLTCLIVDEFRLVPKNIIDSIFEPMLRSRIAKYSTLKEYQQKIELKEEAQSIYLSSSGFATDWSSRHLKKTVNNVYNKTRDFYSVFATDIFTSLKYGLKTRAEYEKQKESTSDINFRIEYLNEIVSESEDSYFSLESFRKNQIIKNALRPPNVEEFLTGDFKVREKKENEKRILLIDFAFAKTTGVEGNDNTAIGCLCTYWKDGKLYRNLEYIETLEGGDINSVTRIRELYHDLDIDYICYDSRNGGDIFAIELTKPFYHEIRGVEYRGFTPTNDSYLQVANEGKVSDLKAKTIDPFAIPCLIPIVGTEELNSNMWMELKKRLNNGTIRFLIDETQYDYEKAEDAEYFLYSSERKALEKMPFIQTTLLINEGINLSPTYSNGRVKLTEPRSGYKDRIVALSYANYIATLYENKLSSDNYLDKWDMNDWSFLAGM